MSGFTELTRLSLLFSKPVESAQPGGFRWIRVNEDHYRNRARPVTVPLVARQQGRDKADSGYGGTEQGYLNGRFLKRFYEGRYSPQPCNILKPHRLKLRPPPYHRAQSKNQNYYSYRHIERWIGFIDEVGIRQESNNRQEDRSDQQAHHGRRRGLMPS